MVSNCIFACNKSSNGGAVYFQGEVDDVVFDSCTFVGNVATNVGGAVGANVSAGGVATFRRCTFKDNAATKYAGAAYRVSCLTNCTFVGNSANDGGAVAYGDSVRNCVFRNNQASNRGGAAHSNTLFGCLLEANSSTSSGGGVYSCQMYGCTNIASRCGGNGCEMASSFAEDCLFREAEPTNSSAKSIFASSALNRCWVEDVKLGWLASGTTSFTNTLFVRCGQAVGSTGITYTYNPGASGVRFVNCTIVSNLLNGCTAGGSSQKTTVFVNCLFYGNRFTSGTKDCDLGERVAEMMGGCTNCIFAATASIPGTGNYNYYADRATFVPGFVGEAADPLNPYALKRSAYGVKKMHGLVADWMTDATDIRGEGFARLREGVVDIGCYQCWISVPGFALIFR